ALVAKSRGLWNPIAYSPRSSARRVIPLAVSAANISGNSVTTSKRRGRAPGTTPSPVLLPVDEDAAAFKVDLQRVGRDEGNEALRVPVDDAQHIVRAGTHQPVDLAERFAVLVLDGQADEVGPVILFVVRLGQGLAWRPDEPALDGFGRGAVGQLLERGNQAAAVRPALDEIHRLPGLV